MPTWSGILDELTKIKDDPARFDKTRRKYLKELYDYTGRNVILYATKWTPNDRNISPETISIVEEDIQGLMTVVHGLEGTDLDLILHSPGGSGETAEFFVEYLRSKFNNIRVFIPQGAMSAATMIACGADEIIMGKHSYLGPIDPQMLLPTPFGVRAIPAYAILEQFEKAKKEYKEDSSILAIWMPILGQYGPGLIMECEHAIALSRDVIENFLRKYMFKDEENAKAKADKIALFLSDHNRFKSHGRHIGRDLAKKNGLRINDLEKDQILQDLVLSVFHSTTHTHSATNAAKIIENHKGIALIKLQKTISMPIVMKKEETENT